MKLCVSVKYLESIGTISCFELVRKMLQSHLKVKVLLTKAGRTSWHQAAQAWREGPTKETGARGKQDDGGVIVPKDLSPPFSSTGSFQR